MAVSDREVVRGMLDRQIENVLLPVRDGILANFPMLSPMVRGFEGQAVNWINNKVDMLMNLSFPTGAETAEEGIANMNEIIASMVGKKLEENGISGDFLNMDLTKFIKP